LSHSLKTCEIDLNASINEFSKTVYDISFRLNGRTYTSLKRKHIKRRKLHGLMSSVKVLMLFFNAIREFFI
jgi:hypothetical protein